MFTLDAFYRRALGINISVYILLFSINLHFIPVFFLNFFFVNYVMVFFTICTVLNGDTAKWRIIMAYIHTMASMVILVFSMVKGSILEVKFILISSGKKLN